MSGPVSFAMFNAAGTISTRNGWLFISQPTQVGQRGVIAYCVSSDALYGYDGIISPVTELPAGSLVNHINAIRQIVPITGPISYWVRSASSPTSSVFDSGVLPKGIPSTSGTISNGWTAVVNSVDIGSYVTGRYVQICVTFQVSGRAARSPAQIQDLTLGITFPGETSDKWAPSVDNSSQSGDSPMYVAWRLQSSYAASVPTLYVRGYDDAGALVASFNTVTDASAFSFTTNNGVTWSPLGTIPNTPLTTELRVLVATPPVTNRINWSLSET
jgi:hypothetical protein